MTVLFHFELCPQGSFICSVWQDFLPFCVYSLCAYTIFCLSFHLLMTIWVTFTSGLLWIVMKWTWECKDLFQTLFSFLSGVYSEVGLLDHMTAGSSFHFLRNLHSGFHRGCTSFHFHWQCSQAPLFSTSTPTLVIAGLLNESHSNKREATPPLVLIFLSLTISDIELRFTIFQLLINTSY